MKNNIEKIILKYEDGREEEVSKGVAISLGEPNAEGDAEVKFSFTNCKGDDLYNIVISVMKMADEMGMFNDSDN